MSLEQTDVAIIGAGPAGLATAIAAVQHGLRVVLFDKQSGPIDKACGEGLMPPGLRALERLGARAFLDPAECAPFEHIVYAQADGTRAVGQLPAPGGLGVRRLALWSALQARAKALGLEVQREGVRAHRVTAAGVEVECDSRTVQAQVVVGADGLNSPTRERAGLKGEVAPLQRFGLRRHVKLAPWGRAVEVHFTEGLEAYVTPAGAQRVGVAFLWEAGAVEGQVRFETLLARFPRLEAQLRGAEVDSAARGAGPLWQNVRRRVGPRVALVGDAAGYVDAITGEGLTQAFEAAEVLGATLPAVIRAGGTVEAFAPYERAAARSFARYQRLARSVLWASRHPTVRGTVLKVLAASPGLFRRTLQLAT